MEVADLLGRGQLALGGATVVSTILLARWSRATQRGHVDAGAEAGAERAPGVTAWLAVRRSDDDQDTARPPSVGIVVANSTGRSIHEVLLQVTIKDRPLRDELSILPAGTHFIEASEHGRYTSFAAPVPADEPGWALHPVERGDTFRVRAVTFTDASGLRWIREGEHHTRAVRSHSSGM